MAGGLRTSGLLSAIAHRLPGDPVELPLEGHLPPFTGATGWLNSAALTPNALRRRVVLVDFWTYTCVNWLRTLPFIRAWAARYGDAGLLVIGAHAPEFDFEHVRENVIARSREFGVTWPIALDNNYGVWQAFANHFWPAVYLADAEGRIRYHHFGEGEYAMTEMAIQQLLRASGATGIDDVLVAIEPKGLELSPDYRTLRSAETYLGYRQATGFASLNGLQEDRPFEYEAGSALGLNHWAPSGTWTITARAAVASAPAARLAFRFQARDVNLVMGPAARGAAIPFRVTLDGEWISSARGSDVDANGDGTLNEQRTYQLIRQTDSITERTFEIQFLEAGAEAFCFTFG